jgi:alpha-L-rhamnosidase
MYVGDTRLEMLTTYAMTPDSRLPKRGIRSFRRVAFHLGMVAEHYPGRDSQLSPTFSLIWVSMIRDFAFWRDDEAFVKERLPGMRGVLEQFRSLRGPSGLLERLPGWPFVDWVRGWSIGNAPDGVGGISSINNLFFVQSLRHAAEVEDAFGDALLAQRNRQLADELSKEIVKRFWVPERNLLADDEKHQRFSEHAQCLALLNGVLDLEKEGPCFQALTSDPNMVRTTVYFSFYLLETFRKYGRGDLILKQMEFWKELARNGFKTPVESPEPSRSDCHAWGSHPLFHQRASLLGVRPVSPGFREVEISPLPGDLRNMTARVPHPRGWIEARLEFDASGRQCTGEITLPPDTRGTFLWQGKLTELAPGRSTAIHVAAE